jgi:uncharacterized protein YbjT (DUF2867 family)
MSGSAADPKNIYSMNTVTETAPIKEAGMKITVFGGSGLIGTKVIKKLTERGHQARAASPSTGVDTTTGQGLVDALAGAEVVVDVTHRRSRTRQSSPSSRVQAAI